MFGRASDAPRIFAGFITTAYVAFGALGLSLPAAANGNELFAYASHPRASDEMDTASTMTDDKRRARVRGLHDAVETWMEMDKEELANEVSASLSMNEEEDEDVAQPRGVDLGAPPSQAASAVSDLSSSGDSFAVIEDDAFGASSITLATPHQRNIELRAKQPRHHQRVSARTPRLGDALVINLGTAFLFHSRALALTTRRLSRRVSRRAAVSPPPRVEHARGRDLARARGVRAPDALTRATDRVHRVRRHRVRRARDRRARASRVIHLNTIVIVRVRVRRRRQAARRFRPRGYARAVDVISYEGPAYDGCCPLTASGAGAGDGEMLACCSRAAGAVRTRSPEAYGRHLACCENKGGSESKNRALSRVWYSGPSYDGCCPNADGENLAQLAGESAGCCPANGERRHSCCPDLGAVREYEDEQEEEEGGEEKENEMSYDDDDRRDRTYDSQDWTRRGVGTLRRDVVASQGNEERISDEDSVSEEDYSTALYLQIAAGVCVVIIGRRRSSWVRCTRRKTDAVRAARRAPCSSACRAASEERRAKIR